MIAEQSENMNVTEIRNSFLHKHTHITRCKIIIAQCQCSC